MKAIIVDDEFSGRSGLKMLLNTYCHDVDVVAMSESATEAIRDIVMHSPDLVFLDIEMPHRSGFDILKSLSGSSFEVIFVTAYNQHAIEAIRYSALDYLLKPVQVEELILAVDRAKKKLQGNKVNQRLNHFLQQSNPREKIAIPVREGFVFINVTDIVRIEADSNYSNIFVTTGEKITSSRTLATFEEMLGSCGYSFMRVHHAHLVNIQYVKAYTKGEGGTLILYDSTAIPVSRRKKEDVLAALNL